MEAEGGLMLVVGLVEFWRRPDSGWDMGSLDSVWEDEEVMGRVDVDRSLSDDLEL